MFNLIYKSRINGPAVLFRKVPRTLHVISTGLMVNNPSWPSAVRMVDDLKRDASRDVRPL